MKSETALTHLSAYTLLKIDSNGLMSQCWTINPNGYVTTLKEAQDYQLMERLKNNHWEIFCLEFSIK